MGDPANQRPVHQGILGIEFAGYDERFRREAIAPIQNKLGQFLLNPVIRNILGQVKCKVSFPFIMDNQRLFIANLSKGKIGHDKANLLGSLLATQFQLAAMGRAGQPENERRDFYLFIDEFQNFTTDSFAAMLAEARKYRLCLTLSHQYIDQIPLPIRQAVFGNVGTLFSFRVGNADAGGVAKGVCQRIHRPAICGLGTVQCVCKILESGTNTQPFKGVTLHPVDNSVGRAVAHVRNSRRRFARNRADVEGTIERWQQPDAGFKKSPMLISSSGRIPRKRRNRRSGGP